MTRTSTEVIRRVYDENASAYIEVSPSPDVPGIVQVIIQGEKSRAHFGGANFSMSWEVCKELGNALTAAALDAEKEES